MKRYFVTDIHRASDAGAMERDLVSWANRIYRNVIVSEAGIAVIVRKISEEQDRIIAEKPRRQKVRVEAGINEYYMGHAYIVIGASQVNMQLVQGEVHHPEEER